MTTTQGINPGSWSLYPGPFRPDPVFYVRSRAVATRPPLPKEPSMAFDAAELSASCEQSPSGYGSGAGGSSPLEAEEDDVPESLEPPQAVRGETVSSQEIPRDQTATNSA